MTHSTPEWNDDFTQVTLIVGNTYDFSLVPTKEMCDAHPRLTHFDAAHSIAEMEAFGMRFQGRDVRVGGDTAPRITEANQHGPVLGLYISSNHDGTYESANLVGTPIEPHTGLRIQGLRRCTRNNNFYRWQDNLMLVITGDPHSEADLHAGHHHSQLDKMQGWWRSLAFHLAPDEDSVPTALHWTDEILGRSRPPSTTTPIPANPAVQAEQAPQDA